MSSEQTFSTNDLRGNAQDYKRDAARKHKWALGIVDGKRRPQRPSETQYNYSRRIRGAAAAEVNQAVKVNRKRDMLEGTAVSDSSDTNSDTDYGVPSPAADVHVVYSFDAVRSPSQGSQILNAALAKAVERFEERETVNLIKNEYDVVDSEGDSVEISPAKKDKGKKSATSAQIATVVDADEDYEFV